MIKRSRILQENDKVRLVAFKNSTNSEVVQDRREFKNSNFLRNIFGMKKLKVIVPTVLALSGPKVLAQNITFPEITTVSYPPPVQAFPAFPADQTFDSNIESLNPMLLRRFQHMKGMVAFLQTGDDADDDARWNFRSKIQDYGCFCYPGTSEQVRYSPGVPIDEIDNTCRRLHRRWHCLENDSKNSIDSIPDDCNRDGTQHGVSRYKWHGVEDPITGHKEIICGSHSTGGYENVINKNQDIICKLRACQIERAFAEELVALDFDDWFDEAHTGMNGRGECEGEPSVSSCGSTNSCESLVDSCCGIYPDRFPFNDGGLKECCADGTVKVAGTCTG